MARALGDLASQVALAQRNRRAPRRLVFALLCTSLGSLVPPAVDAAPLLTLKTRQVRRLQRMVARPDYPGRSAALLELCRSERELALLAPDRAHWLRAAAITCRRLLFDAPAAAEADDALLLLARVEQERGHASRALEAATELERRWPKSPRLCSALLVGAEARAKGCDDANRPGAARRAGGDVCRARLVAELQRIARHRACATPRSALLKRVARYRLAWSLVRSGRKGEGLTELRRLWSELSTRGGFRRRLLRDLARIWASFGPESDTVTLLAGQGALGAELVVRIAEGLVDQPDSRRLLSFVDEAQRRFVSAKTWRVLELQRWSALARAGDPAALQRRLARVASRLHGDAALRRAVSSRLLAAAERLEGKERSRRAAEWIYQRLTRAPFLDAQGSLQARGALARLLVDRGGHARALPHLRAMKRICRRGGGAGREPCREGGYRLLYALEQGRPAKPSKAWQREIAGAASHFIEAYPRDRRVGAVRLLWARSLSQLGDHQRALSVADAGLKNESKTTGGPSPLRVEAIRAARTLRRFAALYRLTQALNREPWRSVAAEAALLEARGRASNDLAGARRWAERAVRARDKKLLLRARILAAKLAARAGDSAATKRHLDALLAGQPRRRQMVVRRRASWALAAGDLATAARAHLDAARQGVGHSDLLAAARMLLWAGQKKRATSLLKRARRRLLAAGDAPGVTAQILAAGRLLEAVAPRRAYGLYLQRASRAWRHEPALAGLCLARAARLAPSAGRAWQLIEQAIEVAGRARGRHVDSVARARLAAAMTLRGQLRALRPGLAVERLSRLVAWLAPILELRLSRLSTAAGLEMAWAFGALARLLPAMDRSLASRAVALGARRDQLLAALAKMARHPAGLDRHTLRALRRAGGASSGLELAHLPTEGRIQGPALRQLRAGRWAAAEAVATAALDLHGGRAPLLCTRAVARAKMGEVGRAVADLQRAHRLAPQQRCVRLSLATVALWRDDLAAARRLLPQAGPEAQVSELAQWLRQATASRLSILTPQVAR